MKDRIKRLASGRGFYGVCALGVVCLAVLSVTIFRTGTSASENITVRSIVGTFLEHSRIYYFKNDGNEELYCSSADWMPRNLERRVEILFPVEEPALREKCKQILEKQLKDTRKAHILGADGNYKKVDKRGKELFNSQQFFCDEAVETAKQKEDVQNTRLFIPETHHE